MIISAILLLTLATIVAALNSKPKKQPAKKRAGFIASLFSDGGKGEALKRQEAGEDALYYYGDQARKTLQGSISETGRDLASEQGLRSREFARTLNEAAGQRGQLAQQSGLSAQGSQGFADFLRNPQQALSAGGQFQIQEATNAMNNSAAARGNRMSGAAAAALQDRAQGIAAADQAQQQQLIMQRNMGAINAGNQAINSQRFMGPQQDFASQLLGIRANTQGALANQTWQQGAGIADQNNAMAATITGTTQARNAALDAGANKFIK